MPAETPKAAPMGPLFARFVSRVFPGEYSFVREVLHAKDVGGSDVAELGLGDGVAGCASGQRLALAIVNSAVSFGLCWSLT